MIKLNFTKSFFIFFTIFFANNSLTAQSIISSSHNSQVNPPGLVAAAPGTYQIIKMGVKSPDELFTTDLLYLIESNRHGSKDIFISIGNFTKVRILPANVINAPGFIPLSDIVVVEP